MNSRAYEVGSLQAGALARLGAIAYFCGGTRPVASPPATHRPPHGAPGAHAACKGLSSL